jgi:glycosyltransferase involved in cell wall biosynthesis
MEASSTTGPAKNLIGFCQWTQSLEATVGGARFSVSLATYCRDPDDGSQNGFIQDARTANIPVHILRERKRYDRRVFPQLRELVSQTDPHIIQTHNIKSHALVKASGLSRSRPWLAFQHGYTTTDLKMRLYNQLDRWSLRSADRVVTVCQAFIPKLVSQGVSRERIRVLHNSVIPWPAVSAEERANLRKSLGIEPEERIILNIGRFSPEKAHADLIRAIGRVHAAVPGAWKVVLVGAGPEQNAVRDLVAQLGLRDRIIFAGFHAKVATFYAISDIFALPSHSEGSPNVILEAMAARVPIAATAAGGTPETVTDQETALLSPVGDIEKLAGSIIRLLTEESLGPRLAEAAFRRAAEEFSPARYMESLANIYLEAIALRARV